MHVGREWPSETNTLSFCGCLYLPPVGVLAVGLVSVTDTPRHTAGDSLYFVFERMGDISLDTFQKNNKKLFSTLVLKNNNIKTVVEGVLQFTWSLLCHLLITALYSVLNSSYFLWNSDQIIIFLLRYFITPKRNIFLALCIPILDPVKTSLLPRVTLPQLQKHMLPMLPHGHSASSTFVALAVK